MRLRSTQAELSRYEAIGAPLKLEADQFRVISRVVFDNKTSKIANFRVESKKPLVVTVTGPTSTNGNPSNFDSKSGLNYADITILSDLIRGLSDRHSFKQLVNVGGGQSTSEELVADDFSLGRKLKICETGSVYKLSEAVEILTLNGDRYVLTVKP
ncbi:MAG: hypothetical protein SGJ20_14460 [Planctomycetota bacterium]|nr:hypothetical protein [Planctomycetota bacterium]